jgi:hypothetical protein
MGYVFSPRWVGPRESLISIFWKFAKANSAAGHIVARLLGPEIDPYEGVVPRADVVDVRRLRHAFALPKKTLYGSLLQASERSRCSDRLRQCRRCMGRGNTASSISSTALMSARLIICRLKLRVGDAKHPM